MAANSKCIIAHLLFVLYHLKKSRWTEIRFVITTALEDLCIYIICISRIFLFHLPRVYKTCVRQVADYLDVVYHSMLTDDLDEELDRLQNHALKIIFGPGKGGRTLRGLAGVTTLRERRVAHCDKFATKCAESSRYGGWFPLKNTRRSGRYGTCKKFAEKFARCERL